MPLVRPGAVARAAFVLVAALALTELVTGRWLRSAGGGRVDPRLGPVHRPHTRLVQSAEGYTSGLTNAYGFLGPELRVTRPARRVLVLGDSFAEGQQVMPAQNFARLLERLRPATEAVNAGQAGLFPGDYADLLPAYDQVFHPDVVVILVNDGDVTEMGSAQRLNDVVRARAARAAAAPAAPAPNRPAAVLRATLGRSAFIAMVRMRLDLLRDLERKRFVRKFTHGTPAFDIDDTAWPPTPRAGAVFDSLLARMKAEHPRLLLLYVPHLRYFDPPPAAFYPLRRAFYHQHAARAGIPIVDPTDAMLAEFARTREPLHGFANTTIGTGHLNRRGHAVLARVLADALGPDRP